MLSIEVVMRLWLTVAIASALLGAIGCGSDDVVASSGAGGAGGSGATAGSGGGSVTPPVPAILIEAESGATTPTATGCAWETTGGTWERTAFACLPDTGMTWTEAELAASPRLDYTIDVPASGDWHVWMLTRSPGTNSELTNSARVVHVGLDGQRRFGTDALPTNWLETTHEDEVVVDDPLTHFNYSFEWSHVGTLSDLTQGQHSLSLWPGEDGLEIDAIYLTPRVEFPRLDPDDGYDLWLRYRPVSDAARLAEYRGSFRTVLVEGSDATSNVIRDELVRGLGSMLDTSIISVDALDTGAIIAGTPESSPLVASLGWDAELAALGDEGFVVRSTEVSGKACTVIASRTPVGALYGAFRLLGSLQLEADVSALDLTDQPKNELRVLQHWDRWNGKIAENFAGRSVFDLVALKAGVETPRYRDYGRALASLGINVVTINSVNAEDEYLQSENLPAIAKLADILRPYGVRMSLAVGFDAPETLGGLDGFEPATPGVPEWWADKVAEIYALIPDFTGLVVKASSEGEPGPSDAVDGANMIADAIRPFGGVVWWRAFVYGEKADEDPDRAKQAYEFFHDMDGQFAAEVILQVKNGPLDFQTREPVSPLFGGMTDTRLGLELQIRQEYTGGVTHAVFLVPAWKEALDFDTEVTPANSRVRDFVTSSCAGIANVGANANWTGHPLAQANWYGFGRLAWDPTLSSETIADEWTRRTYGNRADIRETVSGILLGSLATYERYTLGMAPGTIVDRVYQAYPAMFQRQGCVGTWNATTMKWSCPPAEAGTSTGDVRDQVKATTTHVGYDRTSSGTDYVSQYSPAVAARFEDLDSCPEELLLWFHRVPYTRVLSNKKTLIQSIYDAHFDGANEVNAMRSAWEGLEAELPEILYDDVRRRLQEQVYEARDFRDHVNNYFFERSQIPDAGGRTVDQPFAYTDSPY